MSAIDDALDHHDEAAVDRFTADVEQALVNASPTGFGEWTLKLIGAWILGGALLTLAVRSDDAVSTILYIAGLAVTAIWMLGFYKARASRSWFDD